jgi:hypothetical protein
MKHQIHGWIWVLVLTALPAQARGWQTTYRDEIAVIDVQAGGTP